MKYLLDLIREFDKTKVWNFLNQIFISFSDFCQIIKLMNQQCVLYFIFLFHIHNFQTRLLRFVSKVINRWKNNNALGKCLKHFLRNCFFLDKTNTLRKLKMSIYFYKNICMILLSLKQNVNNVWWWCRMFFCQLVFFYFSRHTSLF